MMHSNTNVVECSLLNTSDQKRLQWLLIIVQKKAVENRVWKKVKKVTLFCIYLHTKLTYLSAARVDGLLALIRLEFILRDVYFSVLVQALFIEKGSCDFGKKMLLFSWTCSPPNQKTLKHPKVDPEGAIIIEDVGSRRRYYYRRCLQCVILLLNATNQSFDNAHSHGHPLSIVIVVHDEIQISVIWFYYADFSTR
jgi:hypothetical protein